MVHLEFDSAKGLGAQGQDIQSGKIDLVLEVADLNKPQDIKAPKNAKSLSDLQQQLGLLGLSSLNGSGSGSGSSSGGGAATGNQQLDQLNQLNGGNTGAGASDPTRQRAYLKCAQKATTVDELKVCGDKLK